jgi:iron complex outermembrane receptor protein
MQVGADGPVTLFGRSFDYRVGVSRAFSESESTLGTGYNYTAPWPPRWAPASSIRS